MIPTRTYGSTSLAVSALGLGAAQLGDVHLAESDVARLVTGAVEAGITLIDTAPGYGLSEERLGRHLGARRERCVLSTKLGYGVDGVEDWTGPCIAAGVEQALRRLRTDRIDIAHLHSCPAQVLARGDVVDALLRARDAGKVRFTAYSGDDADLAAAVALQRFDGFMASVNLVDQQVLERTLPALRGEGFIAKRPSANHPWRFDAAPTGDYCETYWHRWRAMDWRETGMPWGELALRFVLSLEGIASAIVGTGSLAHLQQNIAWAQAGPLPATVVAAIRAEFSRVGSNWPGQV